MASKRLKKQPQKERTDRYKFQIYEQPKNEEHRYIRLTHYMLQHKNYQKLSVYAKVCYNYMRDWAWGKMVKPKISHLNTHIQCWKILALCQNLKP